MSRRPFTSVIASTGMRAVHPQRFDHHCTLTFRPSAEVRAATPAGARVVMEVVGMVITDEVQVAVVEFRDGPVTAADVASGFPHVTISTADGVAPVASIAAVREAIAAGAVVPVRGFFFEGVVDA